jgi:hypothetical protein
VQLSKEEPSIEPKKGRKEKPKETKKERRKIDIN